MWEKCAFKNQRKKEKESFCGISQEPEAAVVLRVLRDNLELGNGLKASRIRLNLAKKVLSLDV